MADRGEDRPDAERDFAREAEREAPSLARELWDWLCQNKKWWLAPLLIVLLIVGLLVVLGGTVLGPFLYPLF